LEEKEGGLERSLKEEEETRTERERQEGRERSRGRTIWRVTLRFHAVSLQVVTNVLKGWMCAGLCMFRWAIISYQLGQRLLCCVFFYVTV